MHATSVSREEEGRPRRLEDGASEGLDCRWYFREDRSEESVVGVQPGRQVGCEVKWP